MKKRVLAVLLAGSMLAGLCGCADNGGNNNSSTAQSNVDSQASQVQANPSSQSDDGLPKGDKDLIKSWGVAYNPRTEGAAYYINVPRPGGKDNLHSTVPDEGYSYLVDERDPYGEIALDAAKTVEEIRPTYEKWIFYDLKEAERVTTMVENQKMTVDSTENIKVNEYEICVTKGTYSCDVAGLSEENQYSAEYPYICYATFLTTGTPVYWVLIDRSEDKSKGDEMEETAMNMAKTLREFDPNDEMSKNEARGEE